MTFKKFQGQIFGVELNAKEQRAVNEEINRQLLERHKEFADDVDYMILKILHDHFGFGPTRLRRFYDLFAEENDTLVERYEMSDAGAYIARKEMNALGVNVEEWNNERSE
jgi:hypothetical protein